LQKLKDQIETYQYKIRLVETYKNEAAYFEEQRNMMSQHMQQMEAQFEEKSELMAHLKA